MNYQEESLAGGAKVDDVIWIRDWSRRRGTVLLLILSLSLVTNVLLAFKVYTLRDRGSQPRSSSGPASPRQGLEAGTKVPSLNVTGTDGQRKIIKYQDGDRPTVLFIVSPACGWCVANLDNMNALAREKGDAYRFVGLSLTDEGVPEFIKTNKPAFPIYVGLSDDLKETYGMGGTPQTIVISTDARVVHNWMGAYNEVNAPAVESYFQIRLPGLRP